ncbi:pectinesterase/pectinesterase inhibitor PPE8B [Beta vulgaris subsp. vulgaris]|uniref:pectinesterase/pectinesterase inhibitor PPE8B n=1 Tax=Beta vulgaris subsp. vulgaris TaxID=3555 RepID=UPI002036E100|nr:pectinesterase/pectinesterase inhibitor PPE8B [Beta vulgaris subsp. vulgaris]
MGKLIRVPNHDSHKSKVVILLLMLIMMKSQALSDEDFIREECLNVPASVFADTLKTTIDVVLKVSSIVAKFGGVFGEFRVSNAISDCLDLLELSSDELSWTLSASQHGKGNGTGDMASDLKTWLSAALSNQETCLEGFDGTGNIVKTIVSGSINQLSSLIKNILHMVHLAPRPIHGSNSRANGARPGGGGRRLMAKNDDEHEFPSWIRSKDRKLLQTTGVLTPNVVVAQDGSGNFSRIMDAIEAAPSHNTDRFVIYVKKGVYEENVEIKRKKTNIMMYGDGMDVTIITSNHSVVDGWTTYRSATFAVTGAGFIARDMTFQNTAGPEKHQAVAFRSDSDLSALYRCAFRGYQDTLYAHANRQFFRECTITGTVDFIFGDGVAVFQNCQIQARKGLTNQKNTITAQGRKDPGENTGFSIQFCNITGDSSLSTTNTTTNSTTTYTYLGRPWKAYSRTIIMESYISGVVRPEGWLEWSGNVSLDTLYYAEYMNYGPGASLTSRVKWPGYHIFNSSAQALNYTVAQFLDGDLWLPTTGIRFASGLSTV